VDIRGWVFGSLRGRVAARFVACLAWLARAGMAVLPLTAAAQEAESTRVTTRVDPCVQIDRESFHRVLAIELGSAIEYSAETAREGSLTTVSLTCTPDGIALLLEDGVTRKSMRRVVDLGPIEPEARSRLLALTVAEFVVASWVELRLPEPAPVAPAGPPAPAQSEHVAVQVAKQRLPPPPPSPAPSPATQEWQLAAAFEVGFFSSTSHPVPGVELRLTQRPVPQLSIVLGVQVAHSEETALLLDQNIGSVRFTTTSGLLAALYTARLTDIDLWTGVGMRIGLAHMAGKTEQTTLTAQAFYALYGGPLVIAGLGYRIGAHVRMNLDLEAGLVTQPAQALIARTVVMELDGAWGSVALGVGWVF
jgi:hypothetical protein